MTTLNELYSDIKSHGFKLTEPRKAIANYLLNSRTHPTVQMIHNDLPQFPVSTIYNTLEVLLDSKIIIELDGSTDNKKHYDLFKDPHYHAVCRNCGKIVDGDTIDFSHLPDLIYKETGYKIDNISIEANGLCPDCQKLLSETK